MDFLTIIKLTGVILFIVLWFTGVYFLVFHQFIKSKSIDGIKDGMALKVGGRFDQGTLTYPFVKIEFYEKNMKIIYSGSTMDLYYNEITDFKKVVKLIEEGLLIKQNKYSFDNEILLFTPYINHINEYLKMKINNDN